MAKIWGKGAQLRYNVDTTPVVVPQVGTINGPSLEGREVETTTHDTSGAYAEFMSTLLDPGQVTAEIVFDPSNATHGVLFTDLTSNPKTTRLWDVRWAQMGSPWHVKFSAQVQSLPINTPVDDAIRATMTLRATGSPTAPTLEASP